MLKDLSPQERKTHRQIELAIMYSRNNSIMNQRNAQEWTRFRKEQHARAIDEHTAGQAVVKAVVATTEASK